MTRAYAGGNGVEEHFFATARRVEQFRVKQGTTPATLVRDRTIYRSSVAILFDHVLDSLVFQTHIHDRAQISVVSSVIIGGVSHPHRPMFLVNIVRHSVSN